jgi:S-adenosylmethionine decarboxylase
MQYYGSDGDINFAGALLTIDMWGAKKIDNLEYIMRILRQIAEVCGATVLDLYGHVFSPNGGISAAAIVQESHIGFHSWPELFLATVDIYLCGTLDPRKALPLLKNCFAPVFMTIDEKKRGVFTDTLIQTLREMKNGASI